ncbi:TPA: hypothetical protein ACQZHR_004506 [Escherichia coli]
MRQVLNINVGLGSDIPAGHSPSIFEACLHAITASKALNDGGNSQLSSEVWGYSGASVSFREAFWLATGGDGKTLNLPIGKLRKGYFVDTMVIDTNGHNLDIIIYYDTTEDILQKLIYNTQRNNICKVCVDGENIYQRGSQRRVEILL